MKPLFSLSIIAACALLLGQGCTGGTSSTANGPDGGVWKTTTRGSSWTQKRVLLKGPKAVTFGNDDITVLAFDPQDAKTIYAGTTERGLVYSLDGGDSWFEAGTPLGRVESVAVDPKNKCAVYMTMRNKIYKTENCMRDWKEMFFDPKTDKVFTRIAVDWYNPMNVYAGTGDGDIFRSTDAGLAWNVAKRVGSGVTAFLFDAKDSRALYVGTRGNGIWKTMDGGATWVQIWDALSKYQKAGNTVTLAMDTQTENLMYLVSGYGILSSADGGSTWTPLTLTSKPGAVQIRDFKVNPRNGKELTYITSNTFMTSSDAGETWTSQKLPSARTATSLLVDPDEGNTFYLGTSASQK